MRVVCGSVMTFVDHTLGLIACRIALAWEAAEETWMGLPEPIGAWERKFAYDRLSGRDCAACRVAESAARPVYRRPSRASQGPPVERSKPIDVVERAGFSLMSLWDGWHPSELRIPGEME